METLQKRLDVLEQQTEQLKRHLRRWRRLAYALGVLGFVALPLASVKAQVGQSLEQRVAHLENEIEQLEYKLVHITSGPDDVTISGANLRIVNGLGATNTKNGLGNLIVGYNEHRQGDTIFCGPPSSPSDTRTGSHNVVVGTELNFSLYGGLVAGRCNDIVGAFSTVTGGTRNVANGDFASVSGGSGNTANAFASSVSGGSFNTASGNIVEPNIAASSVSGGTNNTASGNDSSISGGVGNRATASGSSVSGGENNTANGAFSSVSGGSNRS